MTLKPGSAAAAAAVTGGAMAAVWGRMRLLRRLRLEVAAGMGQGWVVWTLSELEACGGIALKPGRREDPWTLRQRQRVTRRRLRVDRWAGAAAAVLEVWWSGPVLVENCGGRCRRLRLESVEVLLAWLALVGCGGVAL